MKPHEYQCLLIFVWKTYSLVFQEKKKKKEIEVSFELGCYKDFIIKFWFQKSIIKISQPLGIHLFI